ncbi:MAG TPA: sodium-independent anion transporter [Achromobacter sp.]|nr:SulP family inorganic anion transporter [uncultured Achromobacter sp.]HBL67075.1 sodium-independent anion transporter [Achromobacter sp.]
MFSFSTLRRDWLSNPRADILAGVLVALALIPEAIGFSIIAGVDPSVGLYASFSIALVIAFAGGRPAMISAATAAIAVLVVPLVRDHGIAYLFAASVLMGVLQILAGLLRLDLLMQYVSRSVVTGFVNALAILIFMAQLPQLTHVTWVAYAMVAASLAIIYVLPRFTKVIPSPLVAIIAMTALAIYLGLDVNTVGDMGKLPSALPSFALPDVPFTLDTLRIILPYSLTMAAVGLLESMMTAQIVDDMTDTSSDKRRECKGQGMANIVTGFLGGMGGCAMIGQSVINVRSGGRTRLSTFVAATFLLFLIVVLGPLVARIPMPALVAVMIMVSIGTFNWRSLRNLTSHPWQSSVVMLATVLVVVWTHDLARGVLTGVVLSGLFFAGKVKGLLTVTSQRADDRAARVYRYQGQVFFASTGRFADAIDFNDDAPAVVIDLGGAHFWDISAVDALEKTVAKLRRAGKTVEVIGLNEASATMVGKYASPAPGAH